MITGYKLLCEDGGSLRIGGRAIYPIGKWVTVPGNGAYISVTGGLYSGGEGPVLAYFECDGSSVEGVETPEGVSCFHRVRRLPLPSQVELANSCNAGVRRWLAKNPACVPDVQVTLARDKDGDVRLWLAANPACIPQVQRVLARDADMWVRQCLAANPSCTHEVQAILAHDENVWVRRYLAANHSCDHRGRE